MGNSFCCCSNFILTQKKRKLIIMSDQMSEMEKKKAEVRKRMEEQSKSKKKKGFMTPERKKKLRLLLRKKAAEELKKEQERKSAERRKVIDQRCGKPTETSGMSESDLRDLCETYHERICGIESDKYDTEKEAEFNFRNQLKTVKKKEFTLEEEDKEHEKKPDWVLGEKEGKSKSTSEAPPEGLEDVPMVDEVIA